MASPKITLAAETFTVPLDKLDRDPRNVRKTDITAGVEDLANDIAVHGLLQNLGVRPAEAEGHFLVSIGGRRFAALKHLVKTRRLAKNAPIPCRPLTEDEATSAGLAENLSRVAMHPADAYEAFADLIDQGKSVEDVALRFGVTEQTVQRRMRLGRLSPLVLDAFRKGDVSEENAKAFAITTDHAAQERVFAAVAGRGYVHSSAIKSMLTEGEVPLHDRRAQFIGIEAYEAAGGDVRRDLFADHGGGVTLADVELLNRLTLEGLERLADPIRAEGWARVSVQIEAPDRSERVGLKFALPTEDVPLSEADAARKAELEARFAEFEQKDEMTDDESAEWLAVENELAALEEATTRFSAEDAARGSAFIYLGHSGNPVLDRMVPVAGGEPELVSHSPTLLVSGGSGASAATDEAPAKKGLSAALTGSLLAHRTIALQAHVAERPGLALRLLAQSLMMERMRCAYDAPLGLRLVRPETINSYDLMQEVKDTPARARLDEAHERRNDHQPGTARDLLRWLTAKDDSEIIDLIAPLLAEAVNAGATDWTVDDTGLQAQAARAAEFDARPYWTPNAETYFGRISKEQIAEAVQEAGGSISTAGKKPEMAAEATRKVDGTGWLPRLLRLPEVEEAEPLRFAAE